MDKIQKRLLEIFKQVREILEIERIEYYAFAGTLLGAIRHEGFIPWDDDMDIAIKYKDQERMLKALSDKLPDGLEVLSLKNKKYANSGIKIIDKNTTVNDKAYKGMVDGHLSIDIFKLIPQDRSKGSWVISSNILMIKNNKAKGLMKIVKLLCHLFPSAILRKIVLNIKSTNNKGEMSDLNITNRKVSKIPYGHSINVKYEDTYITIPENYKEILSDMYGDYMKLPDKKDRVKHYKDVQLKR